MTRWFVLTLVCALLAAHQVVAQDTRSLIKTIHAIGNEGKGNEAARDAVLALAGRNASEIPDILSAFAGASPLAANYLRAAVESITDRSVKAKTNLPNVQLEKFIFDDEHDPRARRLAFEVLARVDKTAGDRIIPKLLQDSSPEFRRDAVQRLIDQAAAKPDNAKQLYQKALSGATDADQVKTISKALKGLKVNVDLQTHFGFLTDWKIIGPFDNVKLVGFAKVYPPEEKLDFKATLEGQKGDVKWGKITTEDDFGILDIAKSIAPHKGAVMYLSTTFVADKKRDLQFRLGTTNAWKIWVNGKLLFGRDEYHRGMAIDQYTVKASFKPGKNVVLVKLCQNEQTQDWAQRYQLQIRVCDNSGVAVLSADRAKKVATLKTPVTNPTAKTIASKESK
jgi:hypothetical protein